MFNASRLPECVAEWANAAQKSNVATTPIHSVPGPNSGSEIRREQFLTLQILVAPTLSVGGRYGIMEGVLEQRHLDAARNALDASMDWQNYMKSIDQKLETTENGRWATVRNLQYECTPETLRPAQSSLSSSTAVTGGTPRRSARIAAAGSRSTASVDIENLSGLDWESTVSSGSSYGASNDTQKIDDETTANAALITFANGLLHLRAWR